MRHAVTRKLLSAKLLRPDVRRFPPPALSEVISPPANYRYIFRDSDITDIRLCGDRTRPHSHEPGVSPAMQERRPTVADAPVLRRGEDSASDSCRATLRHPTFLLNSVVKERHTASRPRRRSRPLQHRTDSHHRRANSSTFALRVNMFSFRFLDLRRIAIAYPRIQPKLTAFSLALSRE